MMPSSIILIAKPHNVPIFPGGNVNTTVNDDDHLHRQVKSPHTYHNNTTTMIIIIISISVKKPFKVKASYFLFALRN